MKPGRIFAAVLLLLAGAAALAADVPLPDLFNRAKQKYAAGDYKGSLADIDLLDAASAKPGLEAERAKLIAPIAFYRGVNLAGLRMDAEAKEAFIAFLIEVPNAKIESPAFPQPTVNIFERARKEAGGRRSLTGVYAGFRMPSEWKLAADTQWIESPVRLLLSSAQKSEYSSLKTPEERTAFVERFWRELDPTPATPENELRIEFERRVAFADAKFATDKLPGRATDRASVFAFIGLPTYVGVSELSSEKDVMAQLRGADLDTFSRKAKVESWYYRMGRLPQGVPFKEVRFDFITKEGYGADALQKDAEQMQTLGLAVEAVRKNRKLN